MTENVKYVVNGKEYEIWIVPAERGFEVCTYLRGKRIGWTRTAPYEVAHDFNAVTGLGAVAMLIDGAKDDLNRGIAR
jgi:hypothetical protein